MPQGQTARVHILQDGYVRSADDGEHVGQHGDADHRRRRGGGRRPRNGVVPRGAADRPGQSRRSAGPGHRRGVQPPPPRPHGQRGAVPGREDPRPLGGLRRRPVAQPRRRGRQPQPVDHAAGHARATPRRTSARSPRPPTASTSAPTPGGAADGPARGSVQPRPGHVVGEPAAAARDRLGDHPRPRSQLHPGRGHPALPRARPRRPSARTTPAAGWPAPAPAR